MTNSEQIGFVGTGELGSALARAVLDAGIDTAVWNRTAAKAQHLVDRGAVWRSTVSDLVASSAVVVLAPSTYKDVRSVLADTADFDGATIVNLTSGTPADAAAMAADVHARGGRYLDGAAMSGTWLIGDPLATFLYSGDEAAFAGNRQLLDTFGKSVYLGPDPATASAYDTAMLGMILGFLTGAYQALGLLEKQGIDTSTFPTVIGEYWPFVVHLFGAHEAQIRSGAVVSDGGTIDVHRAALGYLIDTAASHGIDTTFADAIATLLQRTSEAGHGGDGLASLARTLTKDAGVLR